MKKTLKFGLTTAFAALAFGLVAPATYMLTSVDAENTLPEITTATFEMEAGGSVRTKSPTGIRFTTYVNETYYASLAEQDYGFGTLVMPKALLGSAELTHSVSGAADVELKVWAESEVDNYMRYTAVLTDIPDTRYAEVLVARSYVRIGTQYTYAINPQERSIAEIAAKALAANEKDEAGVLLSYVDKVATGVTLDKADALVKTGDTLTLAATTAPTGYAVVWETSDAEVATVKDGVVTALKEGEVTVTAKFGTKTATCVVTVKDTVESSYQLADVGAVTLNELGALTWDAVATTQGNIAADEYEVTVVDEEGNENVYTVSENAYAPYTLAAGTYTATVKAAHTKSWIDGSANASAEYKFVVTRYADYSASDLDTSNGKFSTAEHNIYTSYDSEADVAVLQSGGDGYGLIGANDGVSVNMDKNPLIVMDVAWANATVYFKVACDGYSATNDSKMYLMRDTEFSYETDTYVALQASAVKEDNVQALTGEVTNFKIYPGVATSDSKVALRGIYIVSVNEYVEPPVELVKLDAPANVTKSGAVISASAPANKIVDANITYTISVTGEGVNYTENAATALSVDLTQFALVSGETYTVSFTANGDAEGVYHSASDPTTVEVRYTESYNRSDFTGITEENGGFKKRENNYTSIAFNENGITYTIGDWCIFTLHIDMTGKSLTADSVITVNFGDVTEGAKYISGFYTSSGGARQIYFENVVTSNSSNTIFDIYTPRSDEYNGSYIMNNVLYYAFGMGGSGGEKTINVKRIVIADYAILPCYAKTETQEITFDKANPTDKEIYYAFAKEATLKSVAIDGVKLSNDQYTDMVNSVVLKAAALESCSYGEHTVTLTDSNGYSVSVKLFVSSSVAVSLNGSNVEWLEYGSVAGYKVQIFAEGSETVALEETVTERTYLIANKGLESGN